MKLYDGSKSYFFQNLYKFGDKKLSSEYLTNNHSKILEKIYKKYIQYGVDILTTNSFNSSLDNILDNNFSNKIYQISKNSVLIIKSLKNRDISIGGVIGTGYLYSLKGKVDKKLVKKLYIDQIEGLIDGGVDHILIQTVNKIENIYFLISIIDEILKKRGIKIGVAIQLTSFKNSDILDIEKIKDIIKVISKLDIKSLGFNCGVDIKSYKKGFDILKKYSNYPFSFSPSAGYPKVIKNRLRYPISIETFKKDILSFVEIYDIEYIGGCCGVSPFYIKNLLYR